MSVLNNEFLVNLEQFDKLIESAKTNEEINTINMVILSSYEEMVIKSWKMMSSLNNILEVIVLKIENIPCSERPRERLKM